jgi:hypothetical protein
MNVPITFYGKVIDQDGNSLSGAVTVLRVQQPYFDPEYIVKARYVNSNLTTDLAGRFSLNNLPGSGLDLVSMTKDGYEVEPNMIRSYGSTSGTSEKPLIIKMWRKDIKEPLLKGERLLQTVPDGTAYVLDLTNGAILPSEDQSGDLRIWVKLLNKIDDRNSDWSCEIRAINGGLLEEVDSSSPMYIAPVEGYTNTFSLSVNSTNGWNRSTGTLRFFVRLRNGAEYGRFSIDFAAYHRNHGLMRIEYAINASGSRILR